MSDDVAQVTVTGEVIENQPPVTRDNHTCKNHGGRDPRAIWAGILGVGGAASDMHGANLQSLYSRRSVCGLLLPLLLQPMYILHLHRQRPKPGASRCVLVLAETP